MCLSKLPMRTGLSNGAVHKLVCLLVCATLGMPLQAAETIEEIIVTATKREESLQDVPVTMTAFSSETIQELGLTSNLEFDNQVPNFQLNSEFGVSAPTIFLRGFGNESFYSNGLNPIAIYNDGIYAGQNTVQGFQVFDLERVEVLRGPQGTLFGRNATGGLVNFISRKPELSEAINSRLSLTAGEYGQLDGEGAVGVPLGDTAAGRFSASVHTNDGVYENVSPFYDGKDEGAVDAWAARGLIRWQPTNDLDLLLNVHGGKSDSRITAYKATYNDCPPGAVPGEFQNGCSGPFGFGLTDAPGFYETKLSFPSKEKIDTVGVGFEANWDIGRYTLTSVTGFDSAEMLRFENDDGNILSILDSTYTADTDFWSQELRVTSNYSGPFNWLAGFYYYGDELDTQIHFNSSDLFGGVGISQVLAQETSTWSVFSEVSYELQERWKLSVGLRLTDDERDVDIETWLYNAEGVINPGAVPAAFLPLVAVNIPTTLAASRAAFLAPLIPLSNVKDDWFEWSGRAALSYKISDDQMVFASASRGFKGGEFNGGALFAPAEATLTSPEIMEAYEIGYKGTLFNDRVQANLTGFLMKLNNQQVLISDVSGTGGFIPFLSNAGKSESKGIELELKIKPSEAWLVTFNTGYLDATFKEFFDPGTGIDHSGNRPPEAPEWTLSGLVSYQQSLFNGTVSAVVDWHWSDDRFFNTANEPNISQDAYGIVNGRLAYSFWGEKIELALLVKNIFDKEYLNAAFDLQTFGNNIFQPGHPRTVGGQITVYFD